MIALYGEIPHLLFIKHDLQAQLGWFNNAYDTLARIEQLQPDLRADPEFHFRKATIACESGQLREAMRDLLWAQSLCSKPVPKYADLGHRLQLLMADQEERRKAHDAQYCEWEVQPREGCASPKASTSKRFCEVHRIQDLRRRKACEWANANGSECKRPLANQPGSSEYSNHYCLTHVAMTCVWRPVLGVVGERCTNSKDEPTDFANPYCTKHHPRRNPRTASTLDARYSARTVARAERKKNEDDLYGLIGAVVLGVAGVAVVMLLKGC